MNNLLACQPAFSRQAFVVSHLRRKVCRFQHHCSESSQNGQVGTCATCESSTSGSGSYVPQATQSTSSKQPAAHQSSQASLKTPQRLDQPRAIFAGDVVPRQRQGRGQEGTSRPELRGQAYATPCLHSLNILRLLLQQGQTLQGLLLQLEAPRVRIFVLNPSILLALQGSHLHFGVFSPSCPLLIQAILVAHQPSATSVVGPLPRQPAFPPCFWPGFLLRSGLRRLESPIAAELGPLQA